MTPEPKGRTMQSSETNATKALVERLFAAYERGDSQPFFDHVADDVHWTVTGTHTLSGEYRSKREFLEATYERLADVLKQPIQPRVRQIIAEGDLAVVEWRGKATSIVDRPYDNDYCWVIRVAGDRIVEVTAYLDGALVEELFRTTER
jgi:ketosteroid isomerase-like protein